MTDNIIFVWLQILKYKLCKLANLQPSASFYLNLRKMFGYSFTGRTWTRKRKPSLESTAVVKMGKAVNGSHGL